MKGLEGYPALVTLVRRKIPSTALGVKLNELGASPVPGCRPLVLPPLPLIVHGFRRGMQFPVGDRL